MKADDLKPCAEVPVHPRWGRLWGNVRPTGAETPVPRYPLDNLYDQAAIDAARAQSVSLASLIAVADVWERGAGLLTLNDMTQAADVMRSCAETLRVMAAQAEAPPSDMSYTNQIH